MFRANFPGLFRYDSCERVRLKSDCGHNYDTRDQRDWFMLNGIGLSKNPINLLFRQLAASWYHFNYLNFNQSGIDINLHIHAWVSARIWKLHWFITRLSIQFYSRWQHSPKMKSISRDTDWSSAKIFFSSQKIANETENRLSQKIVYETESRLLFLDKSIHYRSQSWKISILVKFSYHYEQFNIFILAFKMSAAQGFRYL